jgi:hypothetical protein
MVFHRILLLMKELNSKIRTSMGACSLSYHVSHCPEDSVFGKVKWPFEVSATVLGW